MGIPFKLYEGKEVNLPAELTAGGIYFCEDSGNVFIDVDIDGTLTRVPLGKKYVDDQLVDIREFIENQGSGIEISSEPPTKESANVWIDTDDEDEEGVEYLGVVTSINGQGGDINITASDIDAVGSELLAAAGGIATLGTDGKLLDAQIPSLAKLGAAPAGYGLGSNSAKVLTNADLLDNVKDGGWYYWNAYSPDGIPSDVPFNIQFGCMRVDNGSFYDYRVQTVYDMGSTYAVQRRIGGSAVISTPWEYINPPLTAGVEYRTTERYNGKPVYTKRLLSDTVMPTDGTVLEIPVAPDTAIDEIWAEYVICRNSSGINVFPSGAGCPQVEFAEDNYDSSNVYIKVTNTGKLSGFKVCVLVKYTKA